ncbi:hypothetical protein EZJ49_09595 [Bdellovibrio bacteriovorus]|uniref:hypothetical protein n=1 Tax=Bdellovibrio bacteriovorus TaxID=959 RepID=UPI0021CF32BA|nr:hypothetical protein [Bdellovibrio bacteriovorus]UXR63327.1 hypothetical protein EZJ49_09595 [Bdellovibrio bacteriovorus]
MRIKHPKISVLIFVVLLLVGIRLILTDIALHRLNGYLAGFSATYAAHVDNLGLSFLRGAYRFERVKVFTKPDHKEFLTVEYVDVSLAWRDLLSLRFRTDIILHKPKLIWSDTVKQALISQKTKEESEKAGVRLFPVEISRLDVRGAEVQMRGEVDSSVVPVEWYMTMELAAGIAKVIFRRGDDRTVSTKTQFSYKNGQFEWSLADLVGKALEHGFRQPLEPGSENEFHMKHKEPPK